MDNEMNENPKIYLVEGLLNFIAKHWDRLGNLYSFLEKCEDVVLKDNCTQLWLDYSAKLGEFILYKTNDCVAELDDFYNKSAELMQATVEKEEVAVAEETPVNEVKETEVQAEAEVTQASAVEVPKEEVAAPVVEETETVAETPQAEAVAVAETTNSQVEAVPETAETEVTQAAAVEVPKKEVVAPVVETETVAETPQTEAGAVAEAVPETAVPEVTQAESAAVAETTNPQAVAVEEVPKEEAVTEVVATTPQAVETAPAPVAEAPQTEQVNVPVAAPVNIFQGTGVEVQPPLTPTNIPVQQSTSDGVIGNIPIIQGETEKRETGVAVSATSEGENVLHVHSDGAKGRALLVTNSQMGNLSGHGKTVALPFSTSTGAVNNETASQTSGKMPSVEELTAQAVALNKAGNSEEAKKIMDAVHELLEGNAQPEAGKQKVLVNTAA